MSDIPPVAPAAPGTAATPSPSTPQQQPDQRTLPQVPVTQAPPSLQSPPQPVTVQGRVISSDPQAQLIRIDTAQGEIDVKSAAQLAPGTDVVVSLATSRGALLASITVLRQQVRISTDLEQLLPAETAPAAPPPPLKAGDTVTALQLPPDPNAPPPQTVDTAPSPAPQSVSPQPPRLLTIEQAVEMLRQMKPEDIARLPLPSGLTPAIVKAALAAPLKAAAFLRALPPEAQQKITAFLSALAQKTEAKPLPAPAPLPAPSQATSKPPAAEEPQAPFQAQPQQETSTKPETRTQAQTPPQPAPAPQPPPPPEDIDANLLQILRAQVGARVTQQALQQSPSPDTPSSPAGSPPSLPAAVLARTLGALLPLMEQLMTPAGDTPAAPRPDTVLAQALPRALQAAVTLPQNMFQLRILSVIPPPVTNTGTPAPPAAPAQAAVPALPDVRVMQGTVESVTSGGLPIIRTDDGDHFVLQSPAPVPVGSRITFEAKPMTAQDIIQQHITQQPTASSAQSSAAPRLNPVTAREWPALAEMLESIEQSAPAVAANVRDALPALPVALPGAPTPPAAARLAPPALLFLAALRLGNVENWLGEKTLQALRDAGRGELADRLAGDFGRIAEQSRSPLPEGWKMISMPLLHDENLSQMQFFVRRQDERTGGGQQGSGRPVTRFLLNLSLSRLGDMQLDGLVHQKQFDLILRTGDPLTLDIRQDIMRRFALGLDQTGMQGGVSFQAKRQNWVTVETPRQRGTVA